MTQDCRFRFSPLRLLRPGALAPLRDIFLPVRSRTVADFRRRPNGQLLAKDLGVVADVDRKGRMEQEIVDRRSQRTCRAQAGGPPRARPAGPPPAGIRPAAARRSSPAAAAPAVPRLPGRPADVRMLLEDCLAGDRVHRPGGREHAMGHAAAKPESPLPIQIAPSPMRCQTSAPSAIFPRALASTRVTYSRVTTGPRTINSPISPGGKPFDFIQRAIGPSTMRITFHSMPGKRRPTQTPAPCAGLRSRFGQDFAWQRSRPPAGPRWRRRACARRLPDGCSRFMRPSTSAGTGAPAEKTRRTLRQADAPLVAPTADAVPDRRRAEGLGHLPIVDRPRRSWPDRPGPAARDPCRE